MMVLLVLGHESAKCDVYGCHPIKKEGVADEWMSLVPRS